MTGAPILSHPVAMRAVPASGLERTFSADASARAALARSLGLVEVRALSATLIVVPERQGVVAVTGRVAAEIVQACVVTLDPVAQSIDEPVEVRYVAADSRAAKEHAKPGAEIAIEPGDPDPPEILAGDILDLGAVALEHFVMAIDPYPRIPGAALPADSEVASAEADSPFAALAGLRDKIAEDG
jgi:uncharacterized metal-binding protein YceD (DUF177 family)